VLPLPRRGTGEDPARICLVAPNHAADGSELRRVQECKVVEGTGAYEALERSGARLVPAIAEAPPGFARSAEGRAYQVKFDLYDRVYLGVAWAPYYATRDPRSTSSPGGLGAGRAAAEIGFDASVLSPHGRSRHDMSVLEGSVTFPDLTVNGLLFSYDYQQEHRRPAFWVTTFLGPPKHFGVPIPFGWGFRLLEVEDRPPSLRDSLDMEWGRLQLEQSYWSSNAFVVRRPRGTSPSVGLS